ncbi:hypothetical protein [Achromobacter phage Motura]|uniref:Uncharacterized protein n=1 Tax=Achromobacter phage Motura TaxID=2591403 RepID=A0A514CTA9_9CAUD|nr:hypothetical protein H1O15_gp265 [Achromobacter phage Motura]QDH83696.1 hypothetical protein [Achromobacter phage Motura]
MHTTSTRNEMKTLKDMMYPAVIYAIYGILFYFWQFQGREAAGTALITLLWVGTCIGVLGIFTIGRVEPEKLKRTPLAMFIGMLISLGIFGVLVWAGNVVLGTVYIIVSFILMARRAEIMKEAGAAKAVWKEVQ